MTILQVIHNYPPYGTGGAEIYAHSLTTAMERKHRTIVFYPKRSDHDPSSADSNNVISFREGYGMDVYDRYPIFNQSSIRDERISRIFRRTLEGHRPDIIHFQHLTRMPLSLIETASEYRIPAVVTLHDFWFLCPRIHFYHADRKICSGAQGGEKCGQCVKTGDGVSKRAAKDFMRSIFSSQPTRTAFFRARDRYAKKLLNGVNVLIAPSKFVKAKFADEGINPERIILLPLGIKPIEKKQNPSARKSMRLGYIGALREHKGVHDLVHAFSSVNHRRGELHVFGGGDHRWLRGKITADASDMITFHGTFDYDRRHAVYNDIDMLVVPSRCYETYSFAAREALLQGIPVLAPRHSVFPEIIVEGRNGFFYEPDDRASLPAVIESLLSGRIRIAKLEKPVMVAPTIEQHSATLLRLYKDLLA